MKAPNFPGRGLVRTAREALAAKTKELRMARESGLAKKETQALTAAEARPLTPMPCDIYESDDEVLLLADLPGVAPDGLKVGLERGELAIEARRSLSVGSAAVLDAEFRDADFRRRFSVPAGIDAAKVVAELKDGVLRLHLPKSEGLKPRQISVKAG